MPEHTTDPAGAEAGVEEWDLWFPGAGATGLPFARARIRPARELLVHAAPPALSVTVRDAAGRAVASGADLRATAETPIARLTLRAGRIQREDIWPVEADCGRTVLLAGGEAGVLVSWWNADDRREWRWRIELYNRLGTP